jgi:hypothetical protein
MIQIVPSDPDPDFYPSRIPGVKKAPDPGSGSATLPMINIAFSGNNSSHPAPLRLPTQREKTLREREKRRSTILPGGGEGSSCQQK